VVRVSCSSYHAPSFSPRLASVRTASATLTRYSRRGNLNPFGIYCLLFGAAMLIYNA
jgi:undecaprenyl pyrophosphate phosphatase UppP